MKAVFKRVSLIGMLLVLAIFIALNLLWFNQHHVFNLSRGLLSTIFFAWRILIYSLILLFWPEWVRWFGERNDWLDISIDYFSKQRHKLVLLFILMELLFESNVLAKTIHFLFV